ncbi:HD domain-containing protein (plasmid) [Pseudomonas aeruginosa]|nr:HD domain-containing protein [Pseudomonas aeruginosa]MCR7874160.1 HD domain-containing protein [Pseudomonas aeruginosa]OWG38433.1 GTP pyrophosphokinase [Stutzerimonas stutzeri]UTN36173.1 HD domain-containing protein [Pseudomonas aeruginosa]HBP4949420.1 HD domain-containing protein [Pseudomonas aeruginosa]
MTTAQPLIELALHRALKAYGGKVDKAGKPYILHPLRLAARLDDQISQSVALLHDVIEDSDTTEDDLREDGFPESVISAVVALTRRKGESYEAFIDRVRVHPLARKIKLLDIEDNMNLLRLNAVTEKDLQRIAKYHRAWKRLDSPE